MKSRIKLTRKGAKDNRIKLVWTKYYKYTIWSKEYYFKQKAYATHSDGWIDSETIKQQTYKNAIKRGNECIEVNTENTLEAPVEHLTIILDKEFSITKEQTRDFNIKATAAINRIKKNSTISSKTENKLYSTMLNNYINSIQKGE